ncbi:MAG: efflux RND transporter periplasmic adaptor subunit [Rhodocyclaceae bacterium]|nr:MAG: efflux RND transporter periplasmic adaptor subunit [Rhodocyclaceae bacterium]
MQKPTRRHWIAAVSVIAIGALGVLAYNANRAPSGPTAPAAPGAAGTKPAAGGPPAFPTAVEVAKVTTARLALDAAAVGSLRSNESVTLRPETAGRIATIGFKDGVAVAKGTLLVALDAATQAAELEQARANRELARSTQQRNQELFEKKFISKQALDASAATLRVQEAAVALAEARLGKTQIRAPFAGVIGIRSVSIGDYVKEGQDLINLEDIATLKVDFRLPEATLPQLKLGQPLEVSVDALPGEKFTATLDAVDPLVDAGGRSVSLRARLDNKAGTLRPGMFVRVRLALAEKADALMLPEQALVPDPAGAFVYRVVEGKAEKVKVRTGVRREAQVEIVEGLAAGDVVVSAGQLKLRPGAPVRDVAAPPPGAASTPAAPAAVSAPARAAQ